MNCEKSLNKFGKYAFGIHLDDTYIYFGMFDKEGNCIKNFVRFKEKLIMEKIFYLKLKN